MPSAGGKSAKRIKWWELGESISGLPVDDDHEIQVQREAIPLVFVPGIMGSRLRRTGTKSEGKGADGLPNMRWDPSSATWMLKYVSNTPGAVRKRLLIGDTFNPAFLEPANANPVGDGFNALMKDYHKKYLTPLKAHDWGPLAKFFDFPVFAVGYNWTDSAENSGAMLAHRIEQIIAEARRVVGLCEKVIVITHSMGGLVTRAASELNGASASILGIVHGVQPVTGTPAAYWRVKAGFEGFGMSSRVLGNSGRTVTPVLGNIPGGLQLLPNKSHRTNAGSREWLTVTHRGKTLIALPKADPYREIYRVKAMVRPKAWEKPSTNPYWALIDPDLLDPGTVTTPASNRRDRMDQASTSSDPWSRFETVLDIAERFHDALGMRAHGNTFNVAGIGHSTADVIEMRVESNLIRSDPYPIRGFRGFHTNDTGNSMQAVLQNPAGDGDGTVARSSASALDAANKRPPGDRSVRVEHQPAYEDSNVSGFAAEAIVTLCSMHYESRRHAAGAAGPAGAAPGAR
jgi:hypothetical protein